MLETLHYTGEFKALIPSGWAFHKLFAMNYRCYWYPLDGEHGDHILVWQAKRYVNFPNVFEEGTAALMRFILKGVTFKEYSDIAKQKLGLTGLAPLELVYDENLNEFRPIVSHEDDMLFALFGKDKNPTKDEMEQWQKNHKHLKKYILSSEFSDLVTKWYNEGMFEFKS